jgi:sulfur carrier protein
MRVKINGEHRDMADGATVAEALELLGIRERRGVAVEVDGTFLEPEAYETTGLVEGSRLEVVRFVGGG